MLPFCMTRHPPCHPARRILLDEPRALSLLGERDLIGPYDRLVLLRTLLVGCFANQLLASSMGFLATRYQTCNHADEKTVTRKRLLCGDKYAAIRCSDLSLTPKQIKRTSPCVTYSTRDGVLKLCTMLFCENSVSVLVDDV